MIEEGELISHLKGFRKEEYDMDENLLERKESFSTIWKFTDTYRIYFRISRNTCKKMGKAIKMFVGHSILIKYFFQTYEIFFIFI